MARLLLNLVLILVSVIEVVYPNGGAPSSQSLRLNSQQKENGQQNERRMQIERRNDDVVNEAQISERDHDGREVILGWYKKNVERRNEGNRYERNHDDQGSHKRIIKTKGYEQKSEYGIPWWYKREAKIEYTDKDLRSDDRSTGMAGNEEKIKEKRERGLCDALQRAETDMVLYDLQILWKTCRETLLTTIAMKDNHNRLRTIVLITSNIRVKFYIQLQCKILMLAHCPETFLDA